MSNTNQSMIGYIKDALTDLKQTKISYFGNKFSAEEVFNDVACVGTFLKHNGVKKGDSVIICLPNIPQGVVALYAINSVGAIANVVHPKIGTDGLVRIVKETNTKWVFMFDRFVSKHRKSLKNLGVTIISCRATDCMLGMHKIIRFSEPNMVLKTNVITYNRTLVKPRHYEIDIKGEETAVYLHSSGTTGEPKTVLLSNYAMNELADNLYKHVGGSEIGLRDGDGMMMILPLFHGFGLAVCVHFMMYFGRIIMIPMFTAKASVRSLRKDNIQFITCVPNMLRKMMEVKGIEGDHLKNLRAIFVGGDKLDDTLRDRMQELLVRNGSQGVCVEGFGLSETASVTHVNVTGKKGGTVGLPMPNITTKIVDENGEEVEPGIEGELLLSCSTMMTGYLNTDNDNITVDENGVRWLDTGDRAIVDEEGYLYYKGRNKRMLKIGGVNIYPQEVEAVAAKIEGIRFACAVRIKQANGKPALKLLVVLQKGVELTSSLKQKICNQISSHILPYATPRVIEKVDEIVMTGMGKTDYRYYENLEQNK